MINETIETGGLLISEEVTILCEIELTKVNQKEESMALVFAADVLK